MKRVFIAIAIGIIPVLAYFVALIVSDLFETHIEYPSKAQVQNKQTQRTIYDGECCQVGKLCRICNKPPEQADHHLCIGIYYRAKVSHLTPLIWDSKRFDCYLEANKNLPPEFTSKTFVISHPLHTSEVVLEPSEPVPKI